MNIRTMVSGLTLCFLLFTSPVMAGKKSPQELEDLYHAVWSRIGDIYYAPEALAGWGEWEHRFDGKLKSRKDLDRAIEDLTSSLNDPWTTYTSQSEQNRRERLLREGFAHMGMVLDQLPDGRFYIRGFIYNSPAQRSRLRVGDIITRVGRNHLEGKSLAEARELEWAPLDEMVPVVYLEDAKEKATYLTVQPIPSPTVDTRYGAGIGYLRIPHFRSSDIIGAVVRALVGLMEKSGGNIQGMVLDLRVNPGGELRVGLAVASVFMEEGMITTTRTRNGRILSEQIYRSHPVLPHNEQGFDDQMKKLAEVTFTVPLVVLIDGSTMSTAELVAAALAETDRGARIVGTPSTGKAVGYSKLTVGDEGELQVTSLSYLTPAGKDISHTGVIPDVLVEQPRTTGDDVQLNRAFQEVREMLAANQ